MSFWIVPVQRRARRALLVGDRDVERHQPRRGGVDGHRGVHGAERDAVEQRAHVAEMADRHADLADLAARQHVIGIVAGLGRQIEGDRKPGLPLGQILAIELVRIARGRMARVGAENPRLVALSLCRASRSALASREYPPAEPGFLQCKQDHSAKKACRQALFRTFDVNLIAMQHDWGQTLASPRMGTAGALAMAEVVPAQSVENPGVERPLRHRRNPAARSSCRPRCTPGRSARSATARRKARCSSKCCRPGRSARTRCWST